jgi:signal transduction histidine kinase
MRDAITEARGLARGLDPIELQNRDLAAALEDLAGETRQRFGIQCRFRCIEPAALRVSRPTGLAIYRICQEAIHNAVTHGESGSVDIDLAVQKGELRIEVRDDGRGFDPAAVHKSGMGLRIMKSRAASAGGHLSMVSKPGEGTIITCIMPLETFAVIEEAKE